MKDLPDGRRRCAHCDRYLRPAAFLRGGPRSWCRSCHAAATRQWRGKNRDAINAGKRAAYAENRVAINKRVRALYRKRREAINARRRAAYAAARGVTE